MKRIFCFILFFIVANNICFASSENVSVWINQKMMIHYGTDVYDTHEVEGESYQSVTKYKFENCRFFNANEKEIFPISYNGTTYMPIRAISGLLEVKIMWDGATNAVYLGEGEVDFRTIRYLGKGNLSELREVKVLRNEDIKIYYNGKLQSFSDVNGKKVYPLSYEGTTYLPIRAVANLFDILIDWDAETNTIFIKRKSNSKIFGDKEIKTNLEMFTDEELEIALNEIFAKYGHDFDTQRIEDYFMQKSWYKKIDGKKVLMTDLTKQEQTNIRKIQREIEFRKTYKDINTIKQPEVVNIENYRAAEVLKDDKENVYAKIFDNVQEALNPSTNETNVSHVELLPSKVYLMNNRYKFYYTFEGESYYIPVEKVDSPKEERIVLMEPKMQIYNNGDLIIDNKKQIDFFYKEAIENDNDSRCDGVIDFLLSRIPASNSCIGFKYNFDNNLSTNEYIFMVAESECESGSTYLSVGKKYIYLNKENTVLDIKKISDLDYTTNLAEYSNLFVKQSDYLEDIEDDYSLKYYGTTSMLNDYVIENFVDAYYIFVPKHGFELVNKTLDGKDIDMNQYIFTFEKEIKFYAKEKYNEEYSDLTDGMDGSKYDKIWYCINEYAEDKNEEENNSLYPNENTLILEAGSKVKVVYAEGYWHIIFKSENEKEAYVIYYTPAGVV